MRRFYRKSRKGQSMVEYMLAVSVISIALAVGFIELTSSQAWRYDIFIERAAALIDPCSSIRSSSTIRPNPRNVPSGPSIQSRPRTP